MSQVAVRHPDRGIAARAGTRFGTERRRGAATLLEHTFYCADRGQRLVAQTCQLVTNGGSSCQTIPRAWTSTSHQSIANIENRLTHVARPAVWTALRRMRVIAQSAGSLRLITVPPFVKPFSTVFQPLADPTHTSTRLFPTDRFLSQIQFLKHPSTSRKTRYIFRRILSAISWRLSFSSVSTHLALTCQHSRGG